MRSSAFIGGSRVPRRRLATSVGVVAFVAIGVAACGGGSTSSPSSSSSSTSSTNLFDPASFNESSVSWLKANVNNNGSPPSTPTGTLNIAGNPDLSDLADPQAEYETDGFALTETYARRLVYYAPSSDLIKSDTVVPDMATSLPTISSDGKTYTFHLRSGVMWNTTPARAVTSKDFVIGLKRECDPAIAPLGNPGYYSAEIAGYMDFCTGLQALPVTASPTDRAAYINGHTISGIATPDNSTIAFTLIAPSVDFVNILAMPFASAAPAEELNFVPETPGNPLYSDGPYEISNCTGTSTASGYNDCTGYNVGHEITLDDNPLWKQSTDPIRHQYLQHIDVKVDLAAGAAGETTVLQEMQAGTTDLSWGGDIAIPPSNLATLASFTDPNFGAFPAPGITNPFLVFNTQSTTDGGALKNVKVRQALEYAVNKAALVKIYGGATFNQPLNQVISPGAQGYQEFNPYPSNGSQGDPATCKSKLAAAGYPNGITLTHYYRTSGNHPSVYQELKSDFAACGVTLNGVPISTGFYGTKGIAIPGANFQAAEANLAQAKWDTAEPGWVPDWFGASNGRAVVADLFDGQQNFPGTDWSGYDSAAVDNLINQAEATGDASKAASLWHQADVKIMADAPFIPFMTQLTPLYHSSRVHNAVWSAFASSYDLTVAWVG